MTITHNQKLPKQQWVILLTLGKYGAMSLQELVRYTSRLLPKTAEKQISSILDDLRAAGLTESTVMQYSILTDAGKAAGLAFRCRESGGACVRCWLRCWLETGSVLSDRC